MITTSDVSDALDRVRSRVRLTPVIALDDRDSAATGWLKLELLQHTGTFKARGAFNRVLAAEERGELRRDVGLVVASGGNAGLANAYVARELGVPATVFVPTVAPPVKVARLRAYGATVVQHGSEYAAAHDAALEHAARTGALHCHAYDQPEIVAGAGTLGLELADQLGGELDTVVVAVGGGGLMAGVAAALEGQARVVGVEPEGSPTLHTALAEGGPTDIPVTGVAVDSLGARRLGDIAHAVASRTGVTSVLVSDDDVVAARRLLWQRYRIVVEHGAATALAALTSGSYRPRTDERVVVVLCGANTELGDLSSGGGAAAVAVTAASPL